MPRRAIAVCAVAVFVCAPTAFAQSFSCGYGDRAACLEYGETVCSNLGKCVSSDAACFESYQCDYEGFTCKSNVTECVSEYNELLGRHNALLAEYNALLSTHNELVESYNALLVDFRGLAEELEDLQAAETQIASCVEEAETADDARECTY